MTKKSLIAKTLPLCSALVFFSSLAEAERLNEFACQVEHRVGFNYQKQHKTWVGSTSDDVVSAYKIKPNSRGSDLKKYPYEWVNASDDSFMGFCTNFNLDAQMTCKGLGKLEFNKDTKRFLYVSDKGYVSYNSPRPKYYVADQESPQPGMAIGTCNQS
ncbi:hypothetical protein [Thalassotalea litorea]|uniref:hypothetical protein n=1 Tax=Thalassotalea litorea TaxID=2020715 RepID=UPI003736FE3D